MSIKQIKKIIKTNFSNIQYFKSQRIKHDDINSVVTLIHTKNQIFTLHEILNIKSKNRIESICKIVNYCYKNKIKVPKPIQTDNKKFLINNIYLTSFIEGKKFSNDIYEFNDLAKNIALLHKKLREYPEHVPKNIHQKYYAPLSLKNLEEIISNTKKSKIDLLIKKNYLLIKQSILLEKKIPKLFRKNKQLIHFDLQPKNILFKNKKLSGILDFNSVQYGDSFEDVLFAGFRFSFEQSSNPEIIKKKMEKFTKNYQKYSKIDKKLIQHQYSILVYIFLERLSYILKKHYFLSSKEWSKDIPKYLKFLQLSMKMYNLQNNL